MSYALEPKLQGAACLIFIGTEGLGRALTAVPAAWRDALFRFQPPPVLDPPWSSAWDRRRLLLQAIGRTGSPAPAHLAEKVFRALPNDETLAAEFAGLAAAVDRAAGRRFFQWRLASGDRDALVGLGQLDDADALAGYVKAHAEELGTTSGAAELNRVIDAGRALDGDARKPLLAALLALPLPSPAVLLPLAISAGVDRPELRAAALDIVHQPAGTGELVSAMQYLGSVAPAELWSALAEAPVAERVATWLAKADDFDWVTVAQELPAPPGGRLPDGAVQLAGTRREIVPLGNGTQLREYAEAGLMILDGTRHVVNHVLGAVDVQIGLPQSG